MTCKTCAYAVFERTPTGRIRGARAGRCTAPIPEVILPACLEPVHWRKSGIWSDSGHGCPVYVKTEVKTP